jgi:hypothetical protein
MVICHNYLKRRRRRCDWTIVFDLINCKDDMKA